MTYRFAFEVEQAGFRWWPWVLIAIASALALLWGRSMENSGEADDDDLTGLFIKFVGIAGLVASVVLLAFTYTEYRSVMQELSSGNCIVSSGLVTNFTESHSKDGS